MTEGADRPPQGIRVVGADANNLRDVDVDFPLRGISIVAGVSGSGKSSLLAGTLAAEGARRTRTYFGLAQREFERDDLAAFVDRLPPTVLVGQRGFRPSIRTTVATATGLLAVLRRLFMAASAPFSRRTGDEVRPPTPAAYADWLVAHYRGEADIWAVPVRQRRTDGAAAVARLARHGVERIQVYGETDPPRLAGAGRSLALDDFRPLNRSVWHTIEAEIASLTILGPASRPALVEALERAFAAGDGEVVVMLPKSENEALAGPYGPRLDSTRHWVDPRSPEIFHPPSAHLLSFNAPSHEESGACRSCAGTGVARGLRLEALIADPDKSMAGGAFSIWTAKNYKYVHIQHETINGLEGLEGFSAGTPWRRLPAAARDLVLLGAGERLIQDRDAAGRKHGKPRPFKGFQAAILDKAGGTSRIAAQLAPLVEEGPCQACEGTRWSPQARALRVGGLGIADLLALPFCELETLAGRGGDWPRLIASQWRGLAEAVHAHAAGLSLAGLGYLSGDRGMTEVSGGESRRVRLSRVLQAGEAGFCLLFDEPARGLHETDLTALAEAFEQLRGRHTIILNEHRRRLWPIADHFIEMGPGAGAQGGAIMRSGPPPRRVAEPLPPQRTPAPVPAAAPRLTVRGATLHNLDTVDVAIPLGTLTCICGVSGSGKSSFVRGVLAPALANGEDTGDFATRAMGRWKSIAGLKGAGPLVALDQTVPSPNRRSLVATMTGVFDSIRRAFAASEGARKEGLPASDFGLNGGRGRCGTCLGLGELSDSDVASPCPACGGARYGPAVLAVRTRGYNVGELLDCPVADLRSAGPDFGISEALISSIVELGLGYVALGRRVDTLSGGELQRLRLAIRLAARGAQSFFLLDEPAAGLHAADVGVLIRALDHVVEGGRNSLVVVDHDLDLIRQSDWVIEFGPGAGPAGGKVIFEGSPDRLRRADTPTGRALRDGEAPPRRRRAREAGHPEIPLAQAAERTQRLLRTLVTGDAPSEELPDEGLAEPVAALGERQLEQRDAWEVGGLDLELPKLLLDLDRAARDGREQALLDEWAGMPGGWLAINPLLAELAVWGENIPASNLGAATRRVKEEGLRFVTDPVEGADKASGARATGARFEPGEGAADPRGALRDALAVGGGYVELRRPDGRIAAAAGPRLLDLPAGLVGPIRPIAADFSRHHPRGRCPACAGTRRVAAVDLRLLLARPRSPVHEEGFLTPEAAAVTRGVRRNAMLPFFRRLGKEGLWDLSRPYAELTAEQKEVALFGFWARPGPGTFLKTPASDPAEVSSWLRWDGFHREVLREADRAGKPDWAAAVRESPPARCPLCAGTGLKPYAALLEVAEKPFPDWARLADPRRQLELLRSVRATTPRQKETRRRLLACLAPLANGADPRKVLEACVGEFTTARHVWL
jgi:excinuclease ABC A subunit